MESVEAFYEKYKIEDFYTAQSNWSTQKKIKPFNKNKHKKLSHKTVPGYRNYDLFFERYKSAVEILQSKGLLKDGMKVLDVGSGEGLFKIFFDKGFDGKIVWDGIEIWKERAEFCRHIGYRVDEINLELGKLPYEDGVYDLVLASHVIEHIPNPNQIIKELGRVLKSDGTLIIAVPTKPPIIAWLDAKYHQMKKSKFGATQQAFTHKSLEALVLNSLGLSKKSVIDKRGFRIISGRKKFPFENWNWFYAFSKYLGRKFMNLVPEINLIVKC